MSPEHLKHDFELFKERLLTKNEISTLELKKYYWGYSISHFYILNKKANVSIEKILA